MSIYMPTVDINMESNFLLFHSSCRQDMCLTILLVNLPDN